MSESRTASIEIAATPQELFEIVADLAAYPEWVQGMEEVEILEENGDGYPHRATMQVDAQIRTLRYTLVYDYDYPGEISWRSESGDVKQLDGAYRFLPQEDETTLVEYELTIDPGFPVPGFLVRQAQKTIMNSALEGLKSQAED
jgi:ribosome-associated toxin RatA of RatAB toxin-antitoxin module